MKVHKYIVLIKDDLLEELHNREYLDLRSVSEAKSAVSLLGSHIQYRLFIPGQGVLGYTKKGQINFFTDNPVDIEEAQLYAKGGDKLRRDQYLGEIDLPDSLVTKIVKAGKELNQAKNKFEESTESLTELLQE